MPSRVQRSIIFVTAARYPRPREMNVPFATGRPACQREIPSVQFSAGPAGYTPIGYPPIIVGQKRRITPRLTHDQAELRFQALFCIRTGEMSGAPLALPGLWPRLTHDLGLRPPQFDPWSSRRRAGSAPTARKCPIAGKVVLLMALANMLPIFREKRNPARPSRDLRAGTARQPASRPRGHHAPPNKPPCPVIGCGDGLMRDWLFRTRPGRS